MGRSAKPVQLATGKATKQEMIQRLSAEAAIRGADDKLTAPDYLTDREKEVYNFILAELEPVQILSNVDRFVIVRLSIAVVRLREIENKVRKEGIEVLKDNLLRIRNSYLKDFDAGMRELALSPQSRAKIGILKNEAEKKRHDPVTELLNKV